MLKRKYDLVIVGAGPAGLTASLYAQRFGIDHLVIDRNKFPKDKICGDAIPSLVWDVLDELGVEESIFVGRRKIDTFRVTFSDNDSKGADKSCFIDTKAARVHNNRRFDFDCSLGRTAFGEDQLLQGKLHSVNADRRVVDVDVEGVIESISFNHLLLCTGSGGIKSTNKDHQSGTGLAFASRAYVQVENAGNENLVSYLSDLGAGYFWSFPVSDTLVNTGVFVHEKKFLNNLYQIHAACLERLLYSNVECKFKRWPLRVFDEKVEEKADRYIQYAGDANHSIDPFLGHGIDTAMLEARERVVSLYKYAELDRPSEILDLIRAKGKSGLLLRNQFSHCGSAERKKELFESYLQDISRFDVGVKRSLDLVW